MSELTAIKVEAGGHWAEIKPAGGLIAADRDAYEDALGMELELTASAGDSPEQIQQQLRSSVQTLKFGYKQIQARRNALLAAVITAWDLGIPLPSEDPESCGKIPLPLLAALEDATEEHSEALTARPKAATRSNSNGGSKGPPGARRRG